MKMVDTKIYKKTTRNRITTSEDEKVGYDPIEKYIRLKN